jgi:hypothetical protein
MSGLGSNPKGLLAWVVWRLYPQGNLTKPAYFVTQVSSWKAYTFIHVIRATIATVSESDCLFILACLNTGEGWFIPVSWLIILLSVRDIQSGPSSVGS